MNKHYEQIPMFEEEQPQHPAPIVENENRLHGLLARTSKQIEALRLDHVKRMTETRYQRIEEKSK